MNNAGLRAERQIKIMQEAKESRDSMDGSVRIIYSLEVRSYVLSRFLLLVVHDVSKKISI